jgi:hypothetical protein
MRIPAERAVACAQIRLESTSCDEHVSIGEKYGDGGDDHRVDVNIVKFKREEGGPGPKAHEQSTFYNERCVNGYEAPESLIRIEGSAPSCAQVARNFLMIPL